MTDRRFFLSYATANDDPLYTRDLVNFRHYAKMDPGVEKIDVYISVSEVHPKSENDEAAWASLAKVLKRNKKLDVRRIKFFCAPGRDWRALYQNLMSIMEISDMEDYLFFNNRSASGPYTQYWYRTFLEHLKTDWRIGGVASTIWLNMGAKPYHVYEGLGPHLQAIGILTRVGDCARMMDNFPGIEAKSTIEGVRQGEAGFSLRLLEAGKRIASLYQPNMTISRDEFDTAGAPLGCPRKEAALRANLPFKYRKVTPLYLLHPQHWLAMVLWLLKRIKQNPSILQDMPSQLWSEGKTCFWNLRRLRKGPSIESLDPEYKR
jgi:hypothetical protein